MVAKPYPVPNSTTSFWRSSLHAIDNHRSTESLPTEADVVIIGAGYAGTSIAYNLTQNQKFMQTEPTIVILEAREACSGATGRNGGHLTPDPYNRAAKALKVYDRATAEEVSRFEKDHIKELNNVIRREKIDCDFTVTRVTDVALYEEGAEAQAAKLKDLQNAHVAGLDDVFLDRGQEAVEVSQIKGAKGCVSFTAAHLYPYKLVTSLLQVVVDRGVNLQTTTPVESVSDEADEAGRWTITTSRGIIKASKVVFAANGYTNALVLHLQDKIVPVRGICSRIVYSKTTAPELPTSSVLRFNDYEYDYLISRSDGSIIVGGARRDYYTDLDKWFNNYDDSSLIESAKHYFDGYMQRHFVGWEDSEAYTDQVWTGIMGYTHDGFPFVGNVPGKPGQFICAGFNGHGMPQAYLAAQALTWMITNGMPLEKSGIPKLYRSTRERWDSTSKHETLSAYNKVMETMNGKS